MNKKDKAKLHTRLKLIKKCVDTDPSKLNQRHGICYHVDRIKQPMYHFDMNELVLNWPQCHKYGNGVRSYAYPVGGMEAYTREQANNTIWSNPRRIDLLNWLIEETKP